MIKTNLVLFRLSNIQQFLISNKLSGLKVGGVDSGSVVHARTQCINLYVQKYLNVLGSAFKQPLISTNLCLKQIKQTELKQTGHTSVHAHTQTDLGTCTYQPQQP